MIKDYIHYDKLEGRFFLLKKGKIYRQIFADQDGYLIFFRDGSKFKLKASKIAVELGNDVVLDKSKVVLHKNLDTTDYRLQNLKIISRSVNNSIKEAQRNLAGALKMELHPTDMFSYVISWKEGRDKSVVVCDITVAKRMFSRLQLKFAKILSKYCVFD